MGPTKVKFVPFFIHFATPLSPLYLPSLLQLQGAGNSPPGSSRDAVPPPFFLIWSSHRFNLLADRLPKAFPGARAVDSEAPACLIVR